MTKQTTTKILEDNRDDIIQMRLDGHQCNEIAEKYNLKRGTVNAWLNRNGITIRAKKTSENIQKVIRMYTVEKMSMEEIGKRLHFSSGTISDILKSNDVEIRPITECNKKYSIDETYFDEINTPNKAYILGFLYADGCRSRNRNTIVMNLQERDKHILEEINSEIGSNRPLRFIDYSDDPSRQNQYALHIDNKHMASSLYKWGIIPCKEFSLEFPDWMESGLVRHFIRGYLDGDGYISKNPNEKRMSFTGTKMMMEGIKTYLKNNLDVHSFIFTPHHKETVTRSLGVAGGNQVKKVLDHLYADAEMYLHRKYDVYQNLYVLPFINNSQVA